MKHVETFSISWDFETRYDFWNFLNCSYITFFQCQDIGQDQMLLIETCWDLVRLLRPSEAFLTWWDSDWDHEVTCSDFQDLWVSWQLGRYFWLRVSTKNCQESWSQQRDHIGTVLVLTTFIPADILSIVEICFQNSLDLNFDWFQLTRPPCLKHTHEGKKIGWTQVKSRDKEWAQVWENEISSFLAKKYVERVAKKPFNEN